VAKLNLAGVVVDHGERPRWLHHLVAKLNLTGGCGCTGGSAGGGE